MMDDQKNKIKTYIKKLVFSQIIYEAGKLDVLLYRCMHTSQDGQLDGLTVAQLVADPYYNISYLQMVVCHLYTSLTVCLTSAVTLSEIG